MENLSALEIRVSHLYLKSELSTERKQFSSISPQKRIEGEQLRHDSRKTSDKHEEIGALKLELTKMHYE